MSIQERILKYEFDVLNIISKINDNIPKPHKIFRISKYNDGKTRRIKVCFDKSESAMMLLRNKEKIPDNIKILSDQTPAQQKYFHTIKEELTRRTQAGENNLTNKYINGVSTIIKQVSKNYSN